MSHYLALKHTYLINTIVSEFFLAFLFSFIAMNLYRHHKKFEQSKHICQGVIEDSRKFITQITTLIFDKFQKTNFEAQEKLISYHIQWLHGFVGLFKKTKIPIYDSSYLSPNTTIMSPGAIIQEQNEVINKLLQEGYLNLTRHTKLTKTLTSFEKYSHESRQFFLIDKKSSISKGIHYSLLGIIIFFPLTQMGSHNILLEQQHLGPIYDLPFQISQVLFTTTISCLIYLATAYTNFYGKGTKLNSSVIPYSVCCHLIEIDLMDALTTIKLNISKQKT